MKDGKFLNVGNYQIYTLKQLFTIKNSIMKLPKNLIEMVECIQLQKDMSLESDNWKTDVNLISQNVIVLGEIFLANTLNYHNHHYLHENP